MPRIGPFIAARPNPGQIDVSSFVTPPYDVISSTERKTLAENGPSFVEVILPEGEDRYRAAAETLGRWWEEEVLVLEKAPALFLYEQTTDVHGEEVTVRGLLAEVSLDPDDTVMPHERVYEDVVSDRSALMRETLADLEPIIAIYDGQEGRTAAHLTEIQALPPLVDVEAACGNGRHRLWRIDDPGLLSQICSDLSRKTMVIADGHHRWTTARRFAQERGEKGSMLMLLQDVRSQASVVLPIHRVILERTLDQVVEALDPHFDIQPASPTPPVGNGHRFVFFDKERAIEATLRDIVSIAALMPSGSSEARSTLDIAILHEAILEELLGRATAEYAHEVEDVQEKLEAVEGVGVLVKATPLDAVLEVAGNGELLPRKSTFFLPKPASGMVLRPHDVNRTGGSNVS